VDEKTAQPKDKEQESVVKTTTEEASPSPPLTSEPAKAPAETKTEEDLKVPEVDKDAPLKIEEQPVEEEMTKPNTKLFIVGIVILIITVIISVSILVLSLRTKPSKETTEEATVIPEEVQTEEEPTLDRAGITFEVLNGSGITGLAKKGADKLEALGYKIGTTGNADEVTENELYLSADLMELDDLILADLNSDFGIDSVTGQIEDATSSAKLIIGEELP
jgi:hypothetical protein